MIILFGLIVPMSSAFAQPSAAGPWRGLGSERFEIQAQRPGGIPRKRQRDVQASEQPPERGRRPDRRLTEEERRELRRDLERANREIYKSPQR